MLWEMNRINQIVKCVVIGAIIVGVIYWVVVGFTTDNTNSDGYLSGEGDYYQGGGGDYAP